MAPGPPPADPSKRRRSAAPAGGEWQHAPGDGWVHGRRPPCPRGLSETSKRMWATWFTTWPASFWGPEDIPMLERLIKLHDRIEFLESSPIEGVAIPHAEFRQLADRFGLSPAARRTLRWLPPQAEEAQPAAKPEQSGDGRRERLRVVG